MKCDRDSLGNVIPFSSAVVGSVIPDLADEKQYNW